MDSHFPSSKSRSFTRVVIDTRRHRIRPASVLLATSCATTMLLVAACGGGGGGDSPTPPITPPVDNFPTASAGEARATFTYRLPASIPSTATSLTAFAGTQPIELTANGAGRSNLPTQYPVVMGLAPSISGNPVALSVNLGATSGQEIGTRSTAEALAFLVPTLVTSNSAQASAVLTALRSSPATAALQTILETRFVGVAPEQVLATADPAVMSALRTVVSDVLRTVPSPRFDQPLRVLPPVETETDRGGVQLTTLPTRDAQGRVQVQLNNGQPRWVSVVRSYSDDSVTWTTPAAENGTFGVMLGAGTASGPSIQSPIATIPLSGAPYVRVKTFGMGSNLAGANADPDSRFLFGAAAAQGVSSMAVSALEPVLATNALRTGLTWGNGDQGTLQSWVTAMMPCFQDPTIMAAIQAGVIAQNMDAAFQLVYSCGMRAGGNSPAVLQGLLSAAGLGGKSTPAAISKMFNVLSNLGTGVEGALNTAAIRSTPALNTFVVVDLTRFMTATSVAPNNGANSGGTSITITGTNFPTSPVPTVLVDGVNATQVTRVSATQLTAVTGAHAASALGDVNVVASGYRTATCIGCYRYGTLPITVASVSSPFADVAGGARVSITGTNFTTVSAVTFGGRAATNTQVVSATRLDVTVPAGAAIGAVNVVVTPTSGSAVTCANCFVYFTPTIEVSPMTGSLAGGTQVTVTDIPATSLLSAVELGTRAATGLTVLSSTSVRFTTPAGSVVGAVDINFRYGALGVLGCPGCFSYANVSNNGRFVGVVLNAITNNPIAGAAVSIRTAGTSTVVDNVITAADGSYRSNPLPAGTYDLHHSATGYNNSPLFSKTLVGGADTPETSLPVVLMVPTGSSSGNLTGSVRDATNNVVVSAATVEIRTGGGNTTGAALATTASAADGSYAFNALPAGTYTVRAVKAGFTEGSVIATVYQAAQTAPVLFMSPTGTSFAWRIVLSWGANPSDLDSHLTGPIAGVASRFHIYFSTKGSLTASPFARLDVDEIHGNGPETITIAQQTPGVYRYYVYKYSGTGDIKTSSARVDLYQGNTLVRQFYPPLQDGTYWTVFELDGGSITTVNTINSSAPAIRAPSVGPLQLRYPRPGDELRELLQSAPVKLGSGRGSVP